MEKAEFTAISLAVLYVLMLRRSSCKGTGAEALPGTATSSYVRLWKTMQVSFSLQLLWPDEDDLMHASLPQGPELNPVQRALVQSSCGLLELSSCFFPGLQTGEGQKAFITSTDQTDHQTESHEVEIIAIAYFPEEK